MTSLRGSKSQGKKEVSVLHIHMYMYVFGSLIKEREEGNSACQNIIFSAFFKDTLIQVCTAVGSSCTTVVRASFGYNVNVQYCLPFTGFNCVTGVCHVILTGVIVRVIVIPCLRGICCKYMEQ